VPTYQYACTACDHRFEAVQSFSDASLTTCPACSGALRKVFSAVGIVFKGSGFYRTDSRSGAKNGSAVNGSAKDSPGGGGGKDSSAKESTSTSSDSSSSSKTGSSSGGSTSGGSSSSGSSSTPAAAAS
jgi:putative FmdB family regulatory protein